MERTPSISGQTFGDLQCIRLEGRNERGSFMYLCRCACGKKTIARKADLVAGKTKSCGCGQGKRSHGLSRQNGRKRPLYSVWIGMRQRCENPEDRNFKRYGGRGILICDEWDDFQVFYNWAMTHGYERGLTIERKDNNGDYCPDNCIWIPLNMQTRNREVSRLLTYNGQTLTFGEWGRIYGIDRTTLEGRIKRGGDILTAFTRKTDKGKRYHGENNAQESI